MNSCDTRPASWFCLAAFLAGVCFLHVTGLLPNGVPVARCRNIKLGVCSFWSLSAYVSGAMRCSTVSRRPAVTWIFLAATIVLQQHTIHAQRFLREGFSNQMESDFRGEMKLDDNEALSGMTREMFLIQDLDWELEPPVIQERQLLDGKLKRHIDKYLNTPIKLKLLKNKGKYGLRAVGILPNGQKLRGFWRQGAGGQTQLKSSEFLVASYDDAVRSRLFLVEFEVQLPPLVKGKGGLPSVVYQVAVEPGSLNPKAYIPRGSGKIYVYPSGHEHSRSVDAGICNVGVSMRAGLVDPTWARGRPFFRKGRSPGLI